MSEKTEIEMQPESSVIRRTSVSEKVRPVSLRSSSQSKNYSPLQNKEEHESPRVSKDKTREEISLKSNDVFKEVSKINLNINTGEGPVKEKSVQLLLANMQQLVKMRNPGERKPFHQKLYKTPKEAAAAFQVASKNKGEMSVDKTAILSFISGVFVCFGGGLAITVAYGSPSLEIGLKKFVFGSCFQVALVFIVLFGGELFTGNTMSMTIGLLSKTITWKGYLRSLVVSFIFNFLGCVFGAAFFNYFGHTFNADPYLTAVRTIAEYKVNLDPEVAFLRAIAANWLVNMAVFMAMSAETIEGKILSCYVPIMTFAASSFEHSVANMYFIPLGLMYGANTDFGTFLYRNLILVTLGNFVGGAFFMACVIWWVYLRGVPNPALEQKDSQQQQQQQQTQSDPNKSTNGINGINGINGVNGVNGVSGVNGVNP